MEDLIGTVAGMLGAVLAALIGLGLTLLLNSGGNGEPDGTEPEYSRNVKKEPPVQAGEGGYRDAVGNIIEPEHLIDTAVYDYDNKGNVTNWGVGYCGGKCQSNFGKEE